MQQEGEGRGTADAARESRQNEERAAGPAAQLTHHETASTTISPRSFLLSQRNGQSPAATTQRTRSKHPPHEAEAEAKPHPSMTWQQNFLPFRPPWNTEPNSTQSHAVHQTRRKGDSGCALPLLPSPHGHGRRKQPPHATASMHYKRSIQIHCNVHLVCVVVCACRNTKQRSRKEEAEYAERRTKMYSGDAWRKQQEKDRSNS
ncbi:hypothetical protein TcCL_Unassigned00209 [Trypanosoma cruzi]|nr:hypothetical protein TcCL_Unassigned00209 [Trypanosoma cruzi]